MLVTDKGIEKAGLLEEGTNSLKESNIEVTVYNEVEQDPPEKNVLDATQQAIENKCDSVIGFGGGSAMDVAKVTAYMANNTTTKLKDIYGVNQMKGERLPLV